MKKHFLKMLALGLIVPFGVALTGCGHEHTYSEAWTTDATHHWHASTCKHTDEKSDYAEHVWTDNYDTTCDTCAYVRVAPVDLWDGTTANVPEAVDGVIAITTAEQLAGVAKAVKEGTTYEGVTIKLEADLNLNNTEWTPIGFGSSGGLSVLDGDSKAFDGNFDGQNHTVYNLKATTFVGGGVGETDTKVGIALFGHVRGSVKNITVDTATVSGHHYVGAVVGFAIGAEIDNCHAKNVAVSCVYDNEDESGDKVGAVVAHVQNHWNRNASIKNCSATNSTVNGARDAGQVVGCLSTNEYGGTTAVTSENLTASNVTVTDNNEVQDAGTNDNIKNEPIGRIKDYRA